VDRTLFKKYFAEGDIPAWVCPSCSAGILQLPEASFYVHADANTAGQFNEDYFEAEWAHYVFTAVLKCGRCKETVIFCGIGGVEQEYEDGPDGGTKYVRYFVPRYFEPALSLIEFPNNDTIPDGIISVVTSSYPLFWADSDACANRLRVALELFLDGMGIGRRKNPDAKRDMNLHDRIELIDEVVFAEVKKMLRAAKLVGNEGSHELGLVTRDDLLDCYEMLEFCIAQVYPPPDNRGRLRTIAEKLIAKKSR
jgi:hypothetical protein